MRRADARRVQGEATVHVEPWPALAGGPARLVGGPSQISGARNSAGLGLHWLAGQPGWWVGQASSVTCEIPQAMACTGWRASQVGGWAEPGQRRAKFCRPWPVLLGGRGSTRRARAHFVNASMFECLKCSNVQMFECLNVQLFLIFCQKKAPK